MGNWEVVHSYSEDDIIEDILWLIESEASDYRYPIGLYSYGGYLAPGAYVVVDNTEGLAFLYYGYLCDSGTIKENNDDIADAMNACPLGRFLNMFDIHENAIPPAKQEVPIEDVLA